MAFANSNLNRVATPEFSVRPITSYLTSTGQSLQRLSLDHCRKEISFTANMCSRRDMSPRLYDATLTQQQRLRLTFDKRFFGILHKILDRTANARIIKRKSKQGKGGILQVRLML
ncbi:hypothetical protein TruAng_005013 [Truncatella angustata]|nr:hypothetical protein TruAng_005013 [Truncatella angustata]